MKIHKICVIVYIRLYPSFTFSTSNTKGLFMSKQKKRSKFREKTDRKIEESQPSPRSESVFHYWARNGDETAQSMLRLLDYCRSRAKKGGLSA